MRLRTCATVPVTTLVLLLVGPFAPSGTTRALVQQNQGTQAQGDFAMFLTKVEHAQTELLNGRPASFKALWSRGSDVTLSGGAGGPVEKGWPAISKRLDWVATQYSDGKSRIERVVQHVSGDLGYVVQHEHIEFRAPSDGAKSTRDYRATMIFRREAGEWKVVHRQADANLTKVPIR